MAETPRRRTDPPAPVRLPTPTTEPPRREKWPEPPAFRAHPLAAPPACANCATLLGSRYPPPRCWGCGRPLCTDCYWRHGLAPAAHKCASCLVRGPAGKVSISGGRSSASTGVSANRPTTAR